MLNPKILILSSIYPGPDIPENFTPVVHYFVKEWKNMGYDVRVIHNSSFFPKPFYWVPKLIKRYIERRVGFPLPDKRLSKKVSYCIDGVNVVRIPIFKFLPMSRYTIRALNNQADRIIADLEQINFNPDIIISHWLNPQLYISHVLKKRFCCRTSLVLHEDGKDAFKFKSYRTLLSDIDIWGYRSLKIRDSFFILHNIKCHFQCFSGIPNIYFENTPIRSWEKCNRIVFIGGLLPRKYPDLVIKGAANVFNSEYFEVAIVGDGPMMNNLKSMVPSYGNNIKLFGRIPRYKTLEILDSSDIFIMISEGEVFGLVYLEAMARGCIVIASEGEGMQGIIIDGYNGFLCEAGNLRSLEETINKIKGLTPTDRKKISYNAIETASHYTDRQVALNYIRSVINL